MLIPAFILGAAAASAPGRRAINQHYTEQIRKLTIKPCFLTGLVDHPGGGRSNLKKKQPNQPEEIATRDKRPEIVHAGGGGNVIEL